MLRRLVGNGVFWLLLCSLPLFVYHTLRPFDYLKRWADSGDYLEMVEMDLLDPQGLCSLRPWGYVIFLKGYDVVFNDWGLAPTHSWWLAFGEHDQQWIDEYQARQLWPGSWLVFEPVGVAAGENLPLASWRYLPTCHLLLHIISVLIFYAGLRQLGFPTVACVLMCLPILYFDYLDLMVHSMLADAPGQAFLLMTVSSFFFVLRKPSSWLRWLSLVFCVFASYHLRAAFQFLLVMLPLVTLLLGNCTGGLRKQRMAMTGAMLAICWLPYLAYCGWRYHVVGQFSLVACTGFQFSGFSGLLVTNNMVQDFRPENQSLAAFIVKGRTEPYAEDQCRKWKAVLDWYQGEDGEVEGWVPPLKNGQPVYEMDYARVQQQYSWVVWQVVWQWAKEKYQDKDSVYDQYLAADSQFMAFSLDFIQKHPDIYAMCVLKGWWAAIQFAFERWAMRIPLILCGLMAPLLSLRMGAPGKINSTAAGMLSSRQQFIILATTIIAFFVFKVQLTAMSAAVMRYGDVDGRYIDTASLLLPCLPMLGVYYLGRCLFARA